jgi:hypothetical protein
MTLPVASAKPDFGAGPTLVSAEGDILAMAVDDQLLVAFADCEMLFTVIGKARGALHLGSWLTPFEYLHWRIESKPGGLYLVTADRAEIERLRRFYRLRGAA